jgi:hypothetical protein
MDQAFILSAAGTPVGKRVTEKLERCSRMLSEFSFTFPAP